MIESIVIIVITCLLVCWNVYLSQYRGHRFFNNKALSLAIMIIWLLVLLVSNISWIGSPFTQKVEGVVVDSETKRPLSAVNIKVGWVVGSYSIGEGGRYVYRTYSTSTDENGKFTVPAIFKPLMISVPLIYERKYEGFLIITYDHGHCIGKKDVSVISPQQVIIEMKPYQSDEMYLENIEEFIGQLSFINSLSNGPRDIDDNDKRYLIVECERILGMPSKRFYGEKCGLRIAAFFHYLRDEANAELINTMLTSTQNTPKQP